MPEDGELSIEEIQRRAALLADIEHRVEIDGPHVAVPSAARAHQFMPFAALRGYGDAVADVEREFEREDADAGDEWPVE